MKNTPGMPVMVIMLILLIAAATYAYSGTSMHQEVVVEEARYHMLLDEYYAQAKTIRDAAPTDSVLTAQLVEIQQYPSQLMELKLLGVGKMLTGIFFLLFAILLALVSMPMRLAAMLKK